MDGRKFSDGGSDMRRAFGAVAPAEQEAARGLALLIGTALQVRSVNLNELAAVLPRSAERLDMRYQWISRVLGNGLIAVNEVMAPFAREVLERSAAGGQTVIVMIDQSKVNEEHQMLMVSLRVGAGDALHRLFLAEKRRPPAPALPCVACS